MIADLFSMGDVSPSGSAVISDCGLYRYRLERGPFDLPMIAPIQGLYGKTFAFFGVNPSTADHTIDDATVRKWIGFTKTWGGKRFIVGNVFAFRATDVRELRATHEPRGDNGPHLTAIAADADVLVPCWGNRDKVDRTLRHHFDATLDLLLATGKPVMHFGLTGSGDPKHPLMLGYDTPLINWRTA